MLDELKQTIRYHLLCWRTWNINAKSTWRSSTSTKPLKQVSFLNYFVFSHIEHVLVNKVTLMNNLCLKNGTDWSIWD